MVEYKEEQRVLHTDLRDMTALGQVTLYSETQVPLQSGT